LQQFSFDAAENQDRILPRGPTPLLLLPPAPHPPAPRPPAPSTDLRPARYSNEKEVTICRAINTEAVGGAPSRGKKKKKEKGLPSPIKSPS